MGVRFSLEHANYVSYLISHDPVVVPRANRRHLSDFLLGLTGFYHTSDVGFTAFDDRAVRIGGPYQLISSDPAWMLPIAAEHQLVLLRGFQGADILPSQIVKSFLDPLRDFFRGFHYVLWSFPSDQPRSTPSLENFSNTLPSHRARTVSF